MTLGSITVRLAMQTADFETDSARAAKIAARRAKEIDASFRKAGIAIGAALGTGLFAAGAAFRKYVQNTIEAEKVQAQLVSRIADTGAVAGRTLQQLNEQADKLQGLTIFDDEAIGGVQAMLLTFKDIRGLQFDKAVDSVLDLSTAMGTDLNSATLQLGKALNDPVAGLGSLSRAGVQFSEDQKAAIKAMVEMGDKAGAQALILRELDSQMGTAAEAARNTLGGALQGLSNSFDNLLEGDTGDAGLRGTVDAVNDLSDVLQDPTLKSGIDAMATGLLKITSASIEAVAWIGNAGMAVADYFGDTSKQSLNVLNNRRNALETELFKAERRSGQGLADAYDPLAKLFGLPSGKDGQVASLKAEIAAIDARLADLRAANAVKMKFSPEYERASLMFNPNPKGGSPRNGTQSGSGAGRTRVHAMPDYSGEDAEALRRLVAETAAADEQFKHLAATLAGPLAEAEYQHQQNLAQITELGKTAGKTSAEVDQLRQMETKRYREQAEAIAARKTPAEEMLANIASERDTIGMTNDQLEIYNRLKWAGVDANSAFGQSLAAQMQDLQAARDAMAQQIDGADAVRDSFKGLFRDMREGMKPIDALTNALDSLADKLFEIALNDISDSLFGKHGSPAGGSLGGLFSSLLGGLFGGNGFASGGFTGFGGAMEPAGIVHKGEVVWSQGDVARAGGVAAVEDMRRGSARGGSTVNQTFVVNGTPDRMTRQQMLRMAGAETSRAIRRG